MMPVRLLVVASSGLLPEIIALVAISHPEIEWVGTAKSGKDAIHKAEAFQADVIMVDTEMPRLLALDAVRKLTRTRPAPIIMASGRTSTGPTITMQAMVEGAVEYIDYPKGFRSIVKEEKARIYGEIVEATLRAHATRDRHLATSTARILGNKFKTRQESLVVIAGGIGATSSIIQLFQTLPYGLRCPILVALPIKMSFLQALVRRLDRMGVMPVSIARDGDCLVAGQALFAPPQSLMRIHAGGELYITPEIRVDDRAPLGDILFLSAARAYGSSCMGIILSDIPEKDLPGARVLQSLGGTLVIEAVAGRPTEESDGRRSISEIAQRMVNHVEREMIQAA